MFLRVTRRTRRNTLVADHVRLKIQPQRKLNLPARAQTDVARNCRTQESKRTARGALAVRLTRLHDVCAGTNREDAAGLAHGWQCQTKSRSRIIKIRAIEDVEDLHPEFDIGRLSQAKLLICHHIYLLEVRTGQEVSRDSAERAWRPSGEGGRIDYQSVAINRIWIDRKS